MPFGKGKPVQVIDVYGDPITCGWVDCNRLAVSVFRDEWAHDHARPYNAVAICDEHHKQMRMEAREREPLFELYRGRM